MPKLNKEALETLVQSQIDSVAANTDPTDVYYAAFGGGKLNPGRCSVATVADLPDPRYIVGGTANTAYPTGHVVYVDSINIPVILSDCKWLTLDGRVFEGETPGELWSWGRGNCGQLGDGTVTDKCSPVREISSSTNWCQVSAGGFHSSAVKTDGTIWSWGSNLCGQLGDGIMTYKCSPVREFCSSTNWCQVSAGGFHSSAVKTDGTIWSWGSNLCGQLGDGIMTYKCSPVREFCSSTNWCQVSAGGDHSTAVKTDGTLWSWGNGACGRLGDGTVITKCSPVREISSSTNWCQVSAGDFHSSAIKTDGTLWSWGEALCGRLGDDTTIDKSSPVQEVSSSTNWCQVSAGRVHSSAVKTDGTLWAWGSGCCGILGDGTSTNRTSPVQETSSSTNWGQVSSGEAHSSAVKTDGTIWSWGKGVYGALGDGTTTTKCSPVQEVSSSTNWYQVSANKCYSTSIKTCFREAQ